MKLLFKMMFEDILLSLMEFVPNHFKRKEMYNEAVRNNLWSLRHIPDRFKIQEMPIKAVEVDPSFLQLVPDWFETQEQLKLWHGSDDWHDDDELIGWYDGYKKRKVQNAKIKEELMPISWHPSRYWDWCMSEDEKKETEKL